MANAWELYKKGRGSQPVARNGAEAWNAYKASAGYKTSVARLEDQRAKERALRSSMDGLGANLAKSTLGTSMAGNLAQRQAVMLPVAEKEPEAPTVGERIGSGVSSIFTRLTATPFVLGEALKADFEATTKAQQDRGMDYSTFDVDPDTFGQSQNTTPFDIDPDSVDQNPNAGVEKYQKPLDPNSVGMKLMRQANEEQARATEGMTGAGKFLADTAISMGSNAALLPLAAINPAIPMAAMGAQAAAGKTYELTEQGKSAGEALGRGIVSGGIEAATEKLPLDTLADLVKTGGKGIVKNILKQAGVEATEEGISYAANYIADKAAGDPDAAFSVAELLESAAAGGLSGLFFGGVGTAANKVMSLPVRGQSQNPATAPTAAQDGVSQNTGPVSLPVANADAGQQKTASTGEAGNSGIIPFNSQEAQNLTSHKGVVSGHGMTFRQFVDNARTLGNAVRFYFGKTSQTLGAKIKQAVGIDVTGYNIAMRTDEVLHAMDSHGDAAKEAKRGHLPVTPEALERLPEVFDDPDEVVLLPKKDYAGRTAFEIRKQLDGYMVAVIGISNGKHSIEVDSVRIINRKGPPTTVNATQSASLDQTSKTSSGQPLSSDTTIPQQGQGVKEEYAPDGGDSIPYVSPDSSVGAAPMGFDPYSHFLNQKSEFFPEGANAARPVDVPTTDLEGRNIRKTAATAIGAKAIPDEAVAEIQKMVMAGKLSYDVNSDKASVERAEKTIRDKGFDGALEYFTANVKKGLVSKDLATVGQQLLVNAANAGDTDALARVLSLYAQMETSAGQAVQAASILRKLPATAQLYAIKRTVADLEGTIRKRYGVEVKVSPELEAEFNAQDTQEGRDAVMEKIYDDVAAQVPATWRDKWNAWRYLAMLGNPRTHIRNMAGNLFYQPLRFTKDAVASAIEKAAASAGVKLERTKTALHDKALYQAALEDWGNVKDALTQGSKYNEATGQIEDRRRIFQLPVLEKARNGNAWALEAEDALFKRVTYADALAKYLEANGVTAEQFRAGNTDPALLARARDYAGQEALKATFQDKNAFSDAVSRLGRYEGESGVLRAASTVTEGLLPFRRTPANILVRGMEYSPLGLAKSLTADLVKVKSGTLSAAQAIDNIAAGLTGSALFGLGAYLLSQGIVTPGEDDDEKQAAIDDLTGGQNYALNLPGGGSVTMDWLAPEALPFFMGVELANSVAENGWTADGLMDALLSVNEPMLEMSMLQSVNDMLESVSYADNKPVSIVTSALTSYLTQAIPTIGGQVERTAEDKRMTTYTDKTLPLPTDVQYTIGRATARLPGVDYQQIPYIDAWGREEEAEPLPVRAVNNFLNPAYTSKSNVTAVDGEVQRLYNITGEGAVVPTRAPKSFKAGGETVNLSKEQYVTYAKTRGQTAYTVIEGLIGSNGYQKLSDTDKADAIQNAYDYANALAKTKVSKYQPDGWIAKAQKSGIDPAVYILYRASADGDGNGSVSQKEAESAIRLLPIADGQKASLWQSQNSTWKAKNNPFAK